MKKATIPEEKRSQSHGKNTTTALTPAELLSTAPSKIARVLVYVRHFDTLNRFEAARKVGDTSLNSTIPALESQYGLTFEHIPEKAANQWGELPAALVSIARIDLSPSKRPDAEQQTDNIKRLVIEARDAERPGHAFLSASGFWPNATPPAKE